MKKQEEIPTHLNTINSSGGFLVVSTDKLSVQYTNVSLHRHDVGVIQANCPAPSRKLVYYFEIFVKNAGAKGQTAIGFTTKHFKMRRQPGWEENSYGYHGDDGLLYRGHGKGESFGPTFTAGDTVGGGINYASQELFFTKNGELVGTIYKDVKVPLYPTIAVHSQNEEVDVNFGKKPFVFDIKAFASEERLKLQMTIEKILLPHNLSHGIVRSYLMHYAYQETLDSFDMASRSTLSPIRAAQENVTEQDGYALGRRKILRQLTRNGDFDATLDKLWEWYPEILQGGDAAICIFLYCQKFIDLVVVGDLEGAVKYARAKLAKYLENASLVNSSGLHIVKVVIRLLAYEEPLIPPFRHIPNMASRDNLADAINLTILLTNPEQQFAYSCCFSNLKILLRQLCTCCSEGFDWRPSINISSAEFFIEY